MKKVLLISVLILMLLVGVVVYQNNNERQVVNNPEITHQYNKEPFKIIPKDKIPESIEDIGLDTLKLVYENMYIEIKKIPNCLNQASSKQEAFICNNTIQELNKELSRAMGNIDDNDFIMNINDFIWDEENKQSMIQEIEKGLDIMKETASCVKEIETTEELSECLQEK